MPLELVIGLFLTGTLVCTGLLGIWAGTSTCHWFLRFAIVFAVLSPLLWAEAIELFLWLFSQIGTVWLVVSLSSFDAKNLTAELGQPSRSRRRFSLLSILLMVCVTALFAAVLVRTPAIDPAMLAGAGFSGVVFGGCVGLGWTAATGRSYVRMLIAVPVAAAMLVAMVYPLYAGSPSAVAPIVLPLVAITAIIYALLKMFGVAPQDSPRSHPQYSSRPRWRRLTQAVGTGVVLVLLCFPLYGLWRLVKPLQIQRHPDADSGTYGEIIEIGYEIASSKHRGTIDNWDTASAASLDLAVADVSQSIADLRTAMHSRVAVPLNYDDDDIAVGDYSVRRTIARALNAKTQWQLRYEQYDAALETMLDTVRYSVATRRGGLIVDALSGQACAHMALHTMHEHHRNFAPAHSGPAARELLVLSAEIEDVEVFKQRDRTWMQAAMGWPGRLQQMFEDLAANTEDFTWETAHDQEQATMRLLAVELALRAFFNRERRYPESLAELVPEYLAHVPGDPFAPGGRPLRYSRSGNAYLIYSVGRDGIDHGASEDLVLDAIYPSDTIGP